MMRSNLAVLLLAVCSACATAPSPPAASTFQYKGVLYSVTDAALARDIFEQQSRLNEAARKLADVTAVHEGLNTWAAQQSHVAPAPEPAQRDPLTQGNRPSVSFQSPSDHLTTLALQNAMRAAGIALDNLTERAVSEGKAVRVR